MANYVVLTDSTSDLTPALIEQLDITVIPMEFHIANRTYLNVADGSTLPFHSFYDLLRRGATSSTSQINPVVFEERFEALLKEGQDILYLAFSSGLSGTYNAACIAAQELSEKYPDRKIRVVDSLAASMGEGLLAYYAATMRKEGKSLDEVAAWLEENKLRLCHWFTVDDLNHLKRGGRVSGATAFVGTLLGIKPVLHVDDEGHLIPVSKVRGRRQSLDALVARMVETCVDPEQQMIFISHGDAKDDAQYVADQVRAKFKIADSRINFIGPVIGSHSGPGTVALFFLGSRR